MAEITFPANLAIPQLVNTRKETHENSIVGIVDLVNANSAFQNPTTVYYDTLLSTDATLANSISNLVSQLLIIRSTCGGGAIDGNFPQGMKAIDSLIELIDYTANSFLQSGRTYSDNSGGPDGGDAF